MKQTIKCFVALVAAVLFSVSAFAQVTTSSISGRVNDSEGAVVGAAVVATHLSSGTTYYSVTDKNGAYRLNAIAPGGPYTIAVEMLGYRDVKFENLYAPLGENLTQNFELQSEAIGLEAAVFTADATDSGMNISRAGAGTSVSEKTMSALPTVSRSINDVMKLTPQASSTSNGMAVGGGNYRSSYVTVDGAAFNNAFGIGSNLPAGGAPISLDALEQMSVNITPFDVRHSGFTGGAINAVTKSGSNEWHASVYDYFTSEQLRGDRVGEDVVNLSKSLNNTTGFTLGGPIIKNKLFFFVNAEYSLDETPGSSKRVRKDESESFGGSTGVVRPTEAFMNEVKDYLAKTYSYDPGRYQGYSLSTPDWKVMARLDWNINNDHRANLRFSHTKNYYSSNPSSSVNPLNPNPYKRNSYGRTSDYAQFFESSRYFQEQNFTSVAAELNSRFLDGLVNNLFRVTWSHQNEPRSFVGDLFPTVDILQSIDTDGDGVNDTRALLTSFGPDPFTYGNLRDVQTVIATDEVTITKGINNIVAGLQFEWNDTKNGYMQGGAGYYVYNSWDDFKSNAAPAAFAITHSNRDDLQQVFPSFNYMQTSAYVQDEMNISEYFKLTAGLRLEMPIYPSIAGNTNKEYLSLAKEGTSLYGTSTADMPKARLNVSPRIGFNWDILKDRSLVLRGGSGIYTGRIPFVWIVSAAGNSNCLQAQYITTTDPQKAGINATVSDAPGFHTNINDILSDLYGGTFKAKDLPAPTATTIMDKNLKMPSTWKSSLALEGRLPGGIKATLEGIYNYDLNSVYTHKLGQKEVEGGVQLPGEPAARKSWKSEGIKNTQNGTVAPYYITNGPKELHGYYYSITAQLQKDFNFGLSLMAAYTHSNSKSLTEGIGDQVSSAYNTMTYTVNGSNTPELGYSSYVSPNRLIANVSYKIQEGPKGATTIGLFYEGYNHCYIGSYSYTRYSYTMPNQTGDGGAYNLIYIPTASELKSMPFSSEDNKAAYETFIQNDKYLSKHRGEYSTRGSAVAPWQNRFNLKFTQDINFNVERGKVNTVQIGFDINNVANLLNSNWGATDRMNQDNILNYKNGKYTFTEPEWTKYNSTFSTWQMLLSLRYFF